MPTRKKLSNPGVSFSSVIIGSAIFLVSLIASVYFMVRDDTTPVKHIVLVNDEVPCSYNMHQAGDTLWIILEP